LRTSRGYWGVLIIEKTVAAKWDLLGEAKELETTALELLGNVIDA
jgi:hypothetical protein